MSIDRIITLAGAFAGLLGAVVAIIAVVHTIRAFKKERLENRKSFLAGIICDRSLSRKYREPFFKEYIANGWNGTIQKAWLTEQTELDRRNHRRYK